MHPEDQTACLFMSGVALAFSIMALVVSVAVAITN